MTTANNILSLNDKISILNAAINACIAHFQCKTFDEHVYVFSDGSELIDCHGVFSVRSTTQYVDADASIIEQSAQLICFYDHAERSVKAAMKKLNIRNNFTLRQAANFLIRGMCKTSQVSGLLRNTKIIHRKWDIINVVHEVLDIRSVSDANYFDYEMKNNAPRGGMCGNYIIKTDLWLAGQRL